MSPPKYAIKFLRWFCREDYIEEIEGDLTEVFRKQYAVSPVLSRTKFVWSVLRYFRPEFIKSFKTHRSQNIMDMFRHNLLLTFRNFGRYKTTFFINLIGLSTGLICSLLIYFWVKDELSYDKFHAYDSQLYEVMLNHAEASRILTAPDSPEPLAKAMAEELPEVEMAVEDSDPAWFDNLFVISDGNVNLKMQGKFAGVNYFKMFSFDFIEGDSAKALVDKSSIAISEKLAKSLFNTTEGVVGKTIEWKILNFKANATISGVFKDIPFESTDRFDFVLPFEIGKDLQGRDTFNWGNYNALTRVKLAKGTDINAFNEKITNFIKKKADWSIATIFVRPFSDRYLYDKYENGKLLGGRIMYVKLFSIIAVFIVVIACINFMNLATARSARRSKEVGIKKAMGARKRSLVYQYLSESMVVTVLSLMIAVIAVMLLLPVFNDITGKHLQFDWSKELIFVLALITIVTGLFSGSYPALYLSAFNPIAVLKGKLTSSPANHGEVWARKGLVVFQFVLSILLIVSVIVVYRQVEFVQSKNLGYDRDNIITFTNDGKVADNTPLFLEEVSKIPGVVHASASAHSFLEKGGYTTGVEWEGKDPNAHVRFGNATVYYDLIETLGVEIKEGRSFSKDFKEDDNLILNETAINVMGLKDPVGKTIKLWGGDKKIIGVAKDFHFASLHEKVQPMFFKFRKELLPLVWIRIKQGEEAETLERLATFYKAFNPGYTFDYSFVDQKYQRLYIAEMRVATLSRYFAGFAVLISCLGLFGLAAFTAERRLKEIGIRKVLGSSEFGIVYLLSGDFTRMVLLAIVVALPLSYALTKEWLNDFAYRIELEWWFFAVAGALALFIAWLTIGMQTFRAARVNPSECLRNE